MRSNTVRIRDHQPSVLGEILSEASRGLGQLAAGALLRHRPVDLLGLFGAAAVALAIVVNAVFLQAGTHPAPFFSSGTKGNAEVASARVAPQPAPRTASPNDAAALPRPTAEIIADIQRELFRRGIYDGAIDGIYGPRTDAAIRDFEQRAGRKPGAVPSEALLRAIVQSQIKIVRSTAAQAPVVTTGSTRTDPIAQLIGPPARVTAVQRALADFGYGQIKPTGTVDRDTRTAIEKFERERKMPVTGQVSDRLVRELAAITGRPIE